MSKNVKLTKRLVKARVVKVDGQPINNNRNKSVDSKKIDGTLLGMLKQHPVRVNKIYYLLLKRGLSDGVYEELENIYNATLTTTLEMCNYDRKSTCANLKAIYHELTRAAMGRRIIPSTPMWYKRQKSTNSIKIVANLIPMLRTGNVELIRYILAIFRSFELITCKPDEKIESIIRPLPLTAEHEIKKYEEYVKKSPFVKTIKNLFTKSTDLRKTENGYSIPFHFNLKKGVGGLQCSTALHQLESLTERDIENMDKLTVYFNGEEISPILINNRKVYNQFKGFDINARVRKNSILRSKKYKGKIVFLEDKACKTRTVASSNYWLQLSTKTLHDICMDVVQKFITDSTKDQTRGAERVRRATQRCNTWSFDLTQATDRLPGRLSQAILTELANKDIGDAWLQLMRSELIIQSNKKNPYLPTTIKYAVGTPMGFYSSWTLGLALVHHVIVQYCYDKTHRNATSLPMKVKSKPFKYFTAYQVLGDDITIWEKSTAYGYRDFLNALGIEISKQKSYTPEDEKDPLNNKIKYAGEFAKRQFIDGKEITAITPKIIYDVLESALSLSEFLGWLDCHNFKSEQVVPISDLFSFYNLDQKIPLNIKNRERALKNIEQKKMCLCAVVKVLQTMAPNSFSNNISLEAFKVNRIISELTQESLVCLRLKKLMKQHKNLGNSIISNGALKFRLEPLIGKVGSQRLVTVTDFYFNRIYNHQRYILEQQIKRAEELLKETFIVPDVVFDSTDETGIVLLSNDDAFVADSKILIQKNRLSDIEFLNEFDPTALVKDTWKEPNKIKLLNNYLTDLSRDLIKYNNKYVNVSKTLNKTNVYLNELRRSKLWDSIGLVSNSNLIMY